MEPRIEVDIIIPVHNAEMTLRETLDSALSQLRKQDSPSSSIVVYVCCYDDASTDSSLDILREYEKRTSLGSTENSDEAMETHFMYASSADGVSRGAGFARNRAVELRQCSDADWCFLCMLDSDDEMKPHRVAEQVHYMMNELKTDDDRDLALLGTRFIRDPPDASWHYANWANTLSNDRLYLERFREVTLIQPTWMISRRRFQMLGTYVEAPHPDTAGQPIILPAQSQNRTDDTSSAPPQLVHPLADTYKTLRLAEDLRFFYTHLETKGTLHLVRQELVVYKHLPSNPQQPQSSQSAQTSRKLLLQLRTYAFEQAILHKCPEWQHNNGKFVVWGAGRDGKDFVKMLSHDHRQRVYCFVDVDEKKIEQGYYANRDIGCKIPIVHYSLLIKDGLEKERVQKLWLEGDEDNDPGFGKISKSKPGQAQSNVDEDLPVLPPAKKQRKRAVHSLKDGELDFEGLPGLPVVVCVALYRTNGALERNVSTIGRVEGKNLWHLI